MKTLRATVKHGTLIFDDLDTVAHVFEWMEGRRVEVTLDRIKKIRSTSQNKFYWLCIIEELCGYTGYSKDEMHNALKMMFLRVPNEDHRLPDTVKSTRQLSTAEFEEYLEQIRFWAAEKLDVQLPLPNQK